MKKRVPLVLLSILLLASPALAARIAPPLELARQSDLLVSGRVVTVDNKTATIQIDKVIVGSYDGKTIVVTPSTASTDVGPFVNFKADEEVLVYLKQNAPGTPATLADHGWGKQTLTPENRDDAIAAAKRIMQLATLKDEDAVNRAMLAEATSTNKMLQQIACNYIRMEIGYGKLRDNYGKELKALLASKDPLVQRAALDGLRFVDCNDVLPRLIELTKSPDTGVVDSASMTLGRYTTPEATAALVALTKSDNPRIRERALIDLGNNHHDTAKATLALNLADKDPRVRASACTSLIYLLREGKGDDLIPRISALLDDKEEETASAAARALGETRNPSAVDPLIAVLLKKDTPRNLQYFTLQALYSHASKDSDKSPLLDKNLALFISIVKTDMSPSGFSPAWQTVGILASSKSAEAKATLQWAAQSHPNLEVRSYAQNCLDHAK